MARKPEKSNKKSRKSAFMRWRTKNIARSGWPKAKGKKGKK